MGWQINPGGFTTAFHSRYIRVNEPIISPSVSVLGISVWHGLRGVVVCTCVCYPYTICPFMLEIWILWSWNYYLTSETAKRSHLGSLVLGEIEKQVCRWRGKSVCNSILACIRRVELILFVDCKWKGSYNKNVWFPTIFLKHNFS